MNKLKPKTIIDLILYTLAITTVLAPVTYAVLGEWPTATATGDVTPIYGHIVILLGCQIFALAISTGLTFFVSNTKGSAHA